MPVPFKRHPSSKVGRRRSHLALTKVKLVKCEKCNKPVKPHMACSFCGTYKGRTVIKIKDKKAKSKK
jgi:large subunit ribosomal protein L32